MPAYAYPIKINRNRKVITEYRSEHVDFNEMTIHDLEKIVGENTFSLDHENMDEGYIVNIKTEREETDKEYSNRIQREEAYMAEYNRRQRLKG